MQKSIWAFVCSVLGMFALMLIALTPKVEAATCYAHTYRTTTITSPTCLGKGKVKKTCTKCGYSTTQDTAALGHNKKTTTKAATCTRSGSESINCTRCGKNFGVRTLSPLAHCKTIYTITKSATCKATGTKVGKCYYCGKTMNTVTIPKLSTHSWYNYKYSGNYKYQKCNVCGITRKVAR
jgi:hypothetical protein